MIMILIVNVNNNVSHSHFLGGFMSFTGYPCSFLALLLLLVVDFAESYLRLDKRELFKMMRAYLICLLRGAFMLPFK